MTKKPPAQEETTSSFDLAKLYVWVKGLEGKVNNLLREVDMLKNDFMKKQSNLKSDVKAINEDVLEIKHLQSKSNQQSDLIIKELKKTAGIEEVETLRKYVDFWNPINFVTQRDLERAIEAKMGNYNFSPIIKNGDKKENNKDK